MKKIEKLLTSLSDHQPIIDGLSEIKVEAGWKLQQPNGVNCSWWSSTEDDTVPTILLDAWARSLYCDSGIVTRDYCNKWFGVSFRCLMD